tara:strand:- start:3 stop:179 length:177 start_codon:yes stop_codon:yes gene_type:complete
MRLDNLFKLCAQAMTLCFDFGECICGYARMIFVGADKDDWSIGSEMSDAVQPVMDLQR